MLLLSQLANIFESDHIAFIKTNCQQEVDILSHNYPQQWIDHYKASHYDRYDYVPKNLDKSFFPLAWGQTEFKKGSKQVQKIYDEASEYQIHSGFCMSFKNSNGDTSGISLVSSQSEKLFKNFIKKEKSRLLSTLFMMNTYFNLAFSPDREDHSLQQIGNLIQDHHHQYLKHQRDLVKSLRLLKAFTVEIDMMVPASVRQHTLPLCRLAQQQFEKYISAVV